MSGKNPEQAEMKSEYTVVQAVAPSGYIRHNKLVGRYCLTESDHVVLQNMTGDMSELKNMSIRQDDIMLLTYPKSGTHWASEILKMMISGKAEYDKETKSNEWIETQDFEELERLKSPRILNTHLAVQDLPFGILEKKCKIVLVHRNPKDVCVSFYHHIKSEDHDLTWDDFFYLFAEAEHGVFYNWFQFTRDAVDFAQNNEYVYTMYYEDMKEDSAREVKKLAKFLEIDLSDDLAEEIADKCSFAKFKKASNELKNPPPFVKKFTSVTSASTFDLCRKGEVANWKKWFTVAQNEKFDRVYEDLMKGCDIKFRYTL